MAKRELQYLHGSYKVREKDGRAYSDVLTYTVKDVNTGETILQQVKDAKRRVWVANNQARESYKLKRTHINKHEVDEYTCHNYELFPFVAQKLKIFAQPWKLRREVVNNPYAFGVDISLETLVKQNVNKSTEKPIIGLRVGGFDIETSMLGGKEILAITYTTHELKSYTCYLEGWLREDSSEKYRKSGKTCSLEEHVSHLIEDAIKLTRENLNEKGGKIFDKFVNMDKLKEKYELYAAQNETDLLQWVFQKVREDKADFISVWNISFDVGYIIDRCSFLNMPPENLFCHPDVPREDWVFDWKEDKNQKVQHVSHRWHWLTATGYSQWYDSMCLYSRANKVNGMELSYSLGYLAGKVLGTTKLDLGEASHAVMQRSRFDEYIAYNLVDTLLLPLFEQVANNLNSLTGLMKHCPDDAYAQQTVQLKNRFYDYCQKRNVISGSKEGKSFDPWDEHIVNVGGNVLDPTLTKGVGVQKMRGINDTVNLALFVSDLDVSSFYPSTIQCINSAQETRLSTILHIDGHTDDKYHVSEYAALAITPDANATVLGKKYFNLPSITDMLDLYDKQKVS